MKYLNVILDDVSDESLVAIGHAIRMIRGVQSASPVELDVLTQMSLESEAKCNALNAVRDALFGAKVVR